MKNFIKLLTVLAALAAAAAAFLAWYGRCKRREEEMDELDDYLMNDDEGHPDLEIAAAVPEDALERDFEEWDSLSEGVTVTVSFHIASNEVKTFQEVMAHSGCSSHYDGSACILDVELTGPQDREDLQHIAESFEEAMKAAHATYLGFTFDDHPVQPKAE